MLYTKMDTHCHKPLTVLGQTRTIALATLNELWCKSLSPDFQTKFFPVQSLILLLPLLLHPVSRQQKGKTSLDLNEARDDGDGSGVRMLFVMPNQQFKTSKASLKKQCQ